MNSKGFSLIFQSFKLYVPYIHSMFPYHFHITMSLFTTPLNRTSSDPSLLLEIFFLSFQAQHNWCLTRRSSQKKYPVRVNWSLASFPITSHPSISSQSAFVRGQLCTHLSPLLEQKLLLGRARDQVGAKEMFVEGKFAVYEFTQLLVMWQYSRILLIHINLGRSDLMRNRGNLKEQYLIYSESHVENQIRPRILLKRGLVFCFND